MLSNEIFMEYVWNIQVYGIYLTYAWYITTSIMCIIHIICQYIYGIYLAYVWHIPIRSIYLTYAWDTTSTKFWVSSRYPYIWHILTWWMYMWCIFHTYGVTWRPPKFRWSRISGICQIHRSSEYMSSLYCHMLIIHLEYSIQSETWTWVFQEYARYKSNKIWNISHTRWLVSQLVLKGKMKGKCLSWCCTATWLMGVIHFMTQKIIF